MTVAFGTSTPTSTTVVATSTSIRPAANSDITRSFSSGVSRPCSAASRRPCSGPSPSIGRTSTTATGGRRPAGPSSGSSTSPRSASNSLMSRADAWADDVGLAAGGDLLADAFPRAIEPARLLGRRDDRGQDRGPAGRQFGQRGDLEVPEHRHRDRARDRRRRHDEQVRRLRRLVAQRVALFDAEAVLLVDDDEAQVGELHLVLDQRVGAHDDAGRTAGCLQQCPLADRGRLRPREQHDARAVLGAAQLTGLRERPQHRLDGPGVLRRRAPRSARAVPPVRRRRRPGASPAARRPSCPSRPRPAAAGASGAVARARP